MGWGFPMRAIAVFLASNLLALVPSFAKVPWVTLSIHNISTHTLIRDDEGRPSTVRVIQEPDASLPSGATTTAAFIYGEYPTRLPSYYNIAYQDKDDPESKVTILWGVPLEDMPPSKASGNFALCITGTSHGYMDRYDVYIKDGPQPIPSDFCKPNFPNFPNHR